ncbi:kinesin K39, putative [Sphingopyxis alaskensis RB2256]|uniref:Kinesin K39, putative n=1 Tax=Sphingopyxis alaskensis (strain DSM 13593 / LMG 18877 / RB2256) TaxID=317655 RepID=Q1GSH7_SPHAL|nr:kinesin K39, putative [Sphingopyxis alaskensis RB2256]
MQAPKGSGRERRRGRLPRLRRRAPRLARRGRRAASRVARAAGMCLPDAAARRAAQAAARSRRGAACRAVDALFRRGPAMGGGRQGVRRARTGRRRRCRAGPWHRIAALRRGGTRDRRDARTLWRRARAAGWQRARRAHRLARHPVRRCAGGGGVAALPSRRKAGVACILDGAWLCVRTRAGAARCGVRDDRTTSDRRAGARRAGAGAGRDARRQGRSIRVSSCGTGAGRAGADRRRTWPDRRGRRGGAASNRRGAARGAARGGAWLADRTGARAAGCRAARRGSVGAARRTFTCRMACRGARGRRTAAARGAGARLCFRQPDAGRHRRGGRMGGARDGEDRPRCLRPRHRPSRIGPACFAVAMRMPSPRCSMHWRRRRRLPRACVCCAVAARGGQGRRALSRCGWRPPCGRGPAATRYARSTAARARSPRAIWGKRSSIRTVSPIRSTATARWCSRKSTASIFTGTGWRARLRARRADPRRSTPMRARRTRRDSRGTATRTTCWSCNSRAPKSLRSSGTRAPSTFRWRPAIYCGWTGVSGIARRTARPGRSMPRLACSTGCAMRWRCRSSTGGRWLRRFPPVR